MFFIINFRFHKPRRKRIDMSLKLFLLNALGGLKLHQKLSRKRKYFGKITRRLQRLSRPTS